MKENRNYIGVDISKLTFDVAYKTKPETYSHYKFSNDKKGFMQLFKLIKEESDCCVVMEASGPYYLALATFLFDKKIIVSVVNPLVIRRFSQMRMMRAKTDKKDAAIIAQYGTTEKPKEWQPEAEYLLELRQMQTFLELLKKNKTAYNAQKEAFSVNPTICKVVYKSVEKNISDIEKQMKMMEQKMEEIVKEHHQEQFEILQSIPGLGKKTSMQLIVLSGGFTKFENAKQLSSFVGLSPRIFESGTSVKGRSRICKMGMSRIRSLLYMCSWTAKSCNKACKELFDRLVAKGKHTRLAHIAVANKLLKQAFALATKNEYYLEKI